MSKRWSYLTVEVKTTMMGLQKADDIQAELSRQGQLGWELVNIIIPAPMRPALLFSRRSCDHERTPFVACCFPRPVVRQCSRW